MQNRPLSVTIVGWVLILYGLLNAVGLAMAMNRPGADAIWSLSTMSVGLQQFIGFAGIAVSLIAGIGALKRQNWTRWLFIVWNIATLGLVLASEPRFLLVLPSLVIFVLIVFFLFRRPANAWFTGAPAA